MFDRSATDDIDRIEREIEWSTGPKAAAAFTGRLLAFCNGLELASERGADRSDLKAGLRIVGFERSVTIAFTVTGTDVLILRVFLGGRDWEDDLTP